MKLKRLLIPVLIGGIALAISCSDMYSGYFEGNALGPPPGVDSISPDTGVDPNLVPGITVTGSNFAPGAMVMLTRTGYPVITASNVAVVSDTEIQCDIILPGAMYGPWNVSVTNLDRQTGVLASAFTVTWPDPTLTGITPNSGSEPNTVFITNLEGAHLMSGATVRLVQGANIITADGVTALSSTQITCSFDLTGAASGAWDVELTNPVGGPAILAGAFTVGWNAPTVTSITPNNGDDPGIIANARITGTSFKAGAAVRLTRSGYADIIATGVTFVNSARIDCNIPLSGTMYGAWNVVVENTDGQSAARANAFTVNWPDVMLSSITPNSGNEPDTVPVTLTGTHFMSGATVRLTDGIIDIWATGVTIVDPTRIDCDIPLAGADYGAWVVVVTNPTGPSDTLAGFTVSWDAPTVTGITPASGTEPNTVIITDLAGTNFKDGAAVKLSRPGYSDINASNITVVSDTRITCRFNLADAMFGDWNIVVTNADSQQGALGGGFTINWPTPTLTSFNPGSSPADVVVALSLVGTGFKDGASVRLVQSGYSDIIATGVTVVSATQITCQVDLADAAYGDWDVVVSNADGQFATGATPLSIIWPAPTLTATTYNLWKCDTATITNLAGMGLKPGASVRLTRTGYLYITAVAVTVVSDTQITCQFDMTTAAAGSWNIVVQNADGQSATLANGVTFRDSFDEDWQSASVWHFPWVYDGPDMIGLATQTYDGTPLGSQCLSIMATAEWTYYDGMHAVFEGGFQPTSVSFRIRKDWDDSCDIFINLGNDYTSGNSGAIFFHWASGGTMSVVGGGSTYAAHNVFHTVEFRNIDFLNQEFDFYVDGAPVTQNVPFNNAVTSFTRMYISAGWWAQNAYIDDIEMH